MPHFDHIVVDVEIQRRVQDVEGGWEATDKLGVSCAVVYEHLTDRYRVYGPDDVSELQSRIMRADRISGFNIWKFDFPVIWGMPDRGRVGFLKPRTDDLLRRIWNALGLDEDQFSNLHKGWGLDAVARGTLGRGKTGNGADAPVWYQQGNWACLVDYCIDDVKLERDLTSFVDKHGFVVNDSRVLRIPEWKPERESVGVPA